MMEICLREKIMVYEQDFVTWENYYGLLCKAFDRQDFLAIREIVSDLKDRYDTKVKHLAEDIRQKKKDVDYMGGREE